MREEDIINKRFHRLTVVRLCENRSSNGGYKVDCLCVCGNEKNNVDLGNLRREKGGVKSCGCLATESAKINQKKAAKANTTHGMSGDRLYKLHSWMMSRCYGKNKKDQINYRNRGITVCDRWHDVHLFIKDISRMYKPEFEMDRINNNKGYYLDNVRFVSRSKNMQNTSVNSHVRVDGVSVCVAEASRITGVPQSTIHYRKKKGTLSCYWT